MDSCGGYGGGGRFLLLLFLLAAGLIMQAAQAQLPIVSVEDFVATELFTANLACNGSFLRNLNSDTVAAIEVPGGVITDVQLTVAPRTPGAPFAVLDDQTFQFTKYGVGALALQVPGLTVDVAFQVKNRVSGKCWDDNGGGINQNLFQKVCVTNIGNGLLTTGLRQLFRLAPLGTLPNCSPVAGSAGDQIYQLQSLASLVANIQRSGGVTEGVHVESNCVTTAFRAGGPSLQPTFFECNDSPGLPINQRFFLSSKPLRA